MPTLKRPLPVLIIGNGPVGLLLAYGLVKQDGEYEPLTGSPQASSSTTLSFSVTSPLAKVSRPAAIAG